MYVETRTLAQAAVALQATSDAAGTWHAQLRAADGGACCPDDAGLAAALEAALTGWAGRAASMVAVTLELKRLMLQAQAAYEGNESSVVSLLTAMSGTSAPPDRRTGSLEVLAGGSAR